MCVLKKEREEEVLASPKGLPEDDRWIVNLSQSEQSDDEKKVLRKGLNFPLARSEVPKIEYLGCVESAFRQLQDVEGANLARAKVSALLTLSRPGFF